MKNYSRNSALNFVARIIFRKCDTSITEGICELFYSWLHGYMESINFEIPVFLYGMNLSVMNQI